MENPFRMRHDDLFAVSEDDREWPERRGTDDLL